MKTAHREFKDATYEQLARLGKALSAPKRLELLDLLCQGPRTVEALAEQAALSVANASQHLQVLRAARLVETEKKGLHVEYRLVDEDVSRFFLALRTLAERRLAELERLVREHFGDRSLPEPVSMSDLLERARKGRVLILDTRPALEYAAGHIAGAISVPIDELKERIDRLPKSKEIVAYCRGPYCIYADQAVTALRASGRRARRLTHGFSEWKAAGFPVGNEQQGASG